MRNSTPSRPALGATFRAVLAATCLAANVPSAIAAGESWRNEFDEAIEIAVAGDLDGGLAILSRLEDQHPDEPEIIRATAQVLARTGRGAEALERFHRLTEMSPDNLTDREAIVYLLLSDGDAEGYRKERQELLKAYEAAGGGKVTRSSNFAREFFIVAQTVNVDAYEFYPDSRNGSTALYYLFVIRGQDNEPKAQLLLARDDEKTKLLRSAGKIADEDAGFYLEYAPLGAAAGADRRALVAMFSGGEPPSYEAVREAVVLYLSERIKS